MPKDEDMRRLNGAQRRHLKESPLEVLTANPGEPCPKCKSETYVRYGELRCDICGWVNYL